MKKNYKFIKIATFFPLFYFAFFFLSMFIFPAIVLLSKSMILGVSYFAILLPLHILAMIDIIYLLIHYLRDIYKNRRVPEDQRTAWVLAILFGNVIAFPVYWSKFIK